MANTRQIKRRIRATENIKKITKAMEAVSAAKLRRAQERAVAARPFAGRLEEMLRRVAAAGAAAEHPLLIEPESNATAYIFITADRGLAGSYNAMLLRQMGLRVGRDENVGLLAVGRKGYEHFRKRGVQIYERWLRIGEDARYELAEEVAEYAMNLFTSGRVGKVKLLYAEFITAMSQRPKEVQLLPVAPPEAQPEHGVEEYIFVPSARELLDVLLPRIVKIEVYQALLEAKASEHGARMTAMRSATDNAGELIETLTLQYNRARQAAITTEISEIVGGAEALKG